MPDRPILAEDELASELARARPIGRSWSRLWPALGAGLLAAAILAALLGFDLWRKYGQLEAQSFRETRNLAQVLDSHVAGAIGSADEMLREFADQATKQADAGGFDPDRLEQESNLLLAGLPASGLLLLAPDGRVVSSSVVGIARGRDLGDSEYFRTIAAKQRSDTAFIGRLVHGRLSGQWLIPMSRGVYRADGTLAGVAVTPLTPTDFVNLFGRLDVDRFSAVTLAHTDGTVIARSPDGDRLVGRSIRDGELFQRYLPLSPAGSVRYRGALFGRELVMSYRTIDGTPFVINVAFDGEEVFRPLMALAATYLLLGLALSTAIGLCVWLVTRDLSRRQALASSRRVRAIIDGMSSFVGLLSSAGTVLEVNRAPLDRAEIKRRNVIGRPLWETYWCSYSVDMQARILSLVKRAAAGEIVREDVMVRAGRDDFMTIDATFHRIGEVEGNSYVLATGVDVTAHRRIEEQLRQSQKMEALGLLTGGIAHDFNNLLASIAHFAEFLSDDLAPGSTARGFAERIRKVSQQGKDVVAQILAYAQPDRAERHSIDLVDVLSDLRELVEAAKPGNAVFDCDLAACPAATVIANRAQLIQILLNLCLNAVDALEGEVGVVRLSMEQAAPEDPQNPLRPSGAKRSLCCYRSGAADATRDYVRISVRDTGSGIAPALMDRIFDPFFTTKERGRGTGLGLAVVLSIVTSLGGIVEVESEPQEGTIFAIYLPLAPPARMAAAPSVAQTIQRGTGRILIVEDDVDLADGMAIGLERAGYEVAVANNPVEALHALNEEPSGWDLVISDQNLPKMSGLELIRKMQAIRPTLPAILHTGIADPVAEGQARDQGVAAFLQKPVGPAQLTATVRAVLDRARSVKPKAVRQS